jgi:hypothetical protein
VADTPRATAFRTPAPFPIPPGPWEWQRADSPCTGPDAFNPFRRRFDRVSLGLRIGGLTAGAAGCLLGAGMPYAHPVAVAVSVLWWGLYLGCFGASLGALLALCTERTAGRPSRVPDGTGRPPTAAGFDFPARKLLEPIVVPSNLLRRRTTGDEPL